MKSPDHDASRSVAEIDVQTRRGRDLLKQASYVDSLHCFQLAYDTANSLVHITTNTNGMQVLDKRAVCAFNIAAVHQATKKPFQALEWLHICSEHLQNSKTSHPSLFDIYYSSGVCNEILKKDQEAVKYYELSLELYHKTHKENDGELDVRQARLISRMARCYSRLNDAPQAAIAHKMAAAIYQNSPQHSAQRLYHLCKLATQLYKGGREEFALDIATECLNESKVKDAQCSDAIYNELALLYTRCDNHEKALYCLDLALSLCKSDDIKATILQNLGAAHNNLGDYENAVDFHSRAASMHGRLRNRRAQCGCFLNLAYAHARLDSFDAAAECYLHAHRAALDVGCTHDTWRALEGGGGAAFCLHRYARAAEFFSDAVRVLNEMTRRSENDELALSRIQLKLDDASRHESNADSSKSSISFTDATSEDSKSLLNTKGSNRRSRKSLSRKLTKLQRQFESIALGIGDYDSGTDQSVFSRRKNRSNKSPRSTLWHERTRPQTARPDTSTGLHHYDHVDKKHKKKQSIFDRITDKCNESSLLNDPPRLEGKKHKRKSKHYDILDAQDEVQSNFSEELMRNNSNSSFSSDSQNNLQSARHLRRSLEKVKVRGDKFKGQTRLCKSDSTQSTNRDEDDNDDSDDTIINDLQHKYESQLNNDIEINEGFDDDQLCKTGTYVEPVQLRRGSPSRQSSRHHHRDHHDNPVSASASAAVDNAAYNRAEHHASPQSTKSNNSISNYFSEQEREVPLVTPEPDNMENTYETIRFPTKENKESQLCTIL